MALQSDLMQRYSINARKLRKNELKSVYMVFHECDQGHKDFLSREDFKMAVVSLLGYKPSKYEVGKLLDGIFSSRVQEKKYPEGVTLEEFVDVMSKKMDQGLQDEEIRQMFMAFDTQCRRFLTIEDLKKVAAQVAPNIQARTLEAAFLEADRDGDGRVSFRDFEFMIRYNEDGNS